jgi:hypothetical protein
MYIKLCHKIHYECVTVYSQYNRMVYCIYPTDFAAILYLYIVKVVFKSLNCHQISKKRR